MWCCNLPTTAGCQKRTPPVRRLVGLVTAQAQTASRQNLSAACWCSPQHKRSKLASHRARQPPPCHRSPSTRTVQRAGGATVSRGPLSQPCWLGKLRVWASSRSTWLLPSHSCRGARGTTRRFLLHPSCQWRGMVLSVETTTSLTVRVPACPSLPLQAVPSRTQCWWLAGAPILLAPSPLAPENAVGTDDPRCADEDARIATLHALDVLQKPASGARCQQLRSLG